MTFALAPSMAKAAFNLFSDMAQGRPIRRLDLWEDDGIDGKELRISEFASLLYYPPESECSGLYLNFEGSDNIYPVDTIELSGVLAKNECVVYTALKIRFDMSELCVPTTYDPTKEVTV